MTETLQEFCDSRGVAMRVDRQAGVIRGAKILGLRSRNGRAYLPETLKQAATLYEDAKVNVNHPKGNPNAPRDYRDRIGVIRSVAVRPGEGLFADFHFNPKHALAEQLLWDAEHAPENVGFSHNVQARTARRGENVVVEAITKVQSVDLVADPATTRGLFESKARDEADPADENLTVDTLRRDHPRLVEALCREQAAEIGRLREEVQRLSARETQQQRRQLIRRTLCEFRLPQPDADDAWTDGPSTGKPHAAVLGDRFLESLLTAADEKAVRELIEERAQLVRSLSARRSESGASDGRPLSRDQHVFGRTERTDTKAFVEAIT